MNKKRRKKTVQILLVAFLGLLSSNSSYGDIINPGFEDPQITSGTFLIFSLGQTIGGAWSVIGDTGDNVLVIDTNYTEFENGGTLFNSFEGTQSLDLTGGNNSSTNGISQVVDTIVGQEYLLSFFVGTATPADGPSGFYPSFATVDLALDGGQRISFENPVRFEGFISWQEYSHRFVASSTSTTFTFFNGTPFDTHYTGLDSIRLSEIPEADLSFNVTHGRFASGTISELAFSDNLDLIVQRNPSEIQSHVFVEFSSNSPTELPSQLQFTIEAAVFARSSVQQSIDLFNYQTNEFEEVDTRTASRFSDLIVTVEPAGDVSRFVEPGTRSIEARVRFQSASARQQFSANIDHIFWAID